MNWELIRQNWAIIIAIVAIVATNARSEVIQDQHGKDIRILQNGNAAFAELRESINEINTQVQVITTKQEHDQEDIDKMQGTLDNIEQLLINRLPPR